MITAIFFAILFCVLSVFLYWYDGIFLKILNGLLGILVGFIVGFFISLALPAKTEVITTKYQMVSIESDTTNFVIGKTDNVKNGDYYVCFCIIDGDTVVKHFPVEETHIKYVNNSDTIRVKKDFESMVNGSFVNKFATDMDKTTYTLYLPKIYSQTIFDFEL